MPHMPMGMPALALISLLASGCAAHGHTRVIYAPPPSTTTVVHQPPQSTYIQYHYVQVNSNWVRRSGPPPAGVRYQRHPTQRRSVIVHRSTSSRPPARRPSTVHRSTEHRHTKDCRHPNRRSTKRR